MRKSKERERKRETMRFSAQTRVVTWMREIEIEREKKRKRKREKEREREGENASQYHCTKRSDPVKSLVTQRETLV